VLLTYSSKLPVIKKAETIPEYRFAFLLFCPFLKKNDNREVPEYTKKINTSKIPT
jgi:hypothetical protein